MILNKASPIGDIVKEKGIPSPPKLDQQSILPNLNQLPSGNARDIPME